MKQHETFADNTTIKIYINKSKIRTTFKIKTRYCLELFTLEQ